LKARPAQKAAHERRPRQIATVGRRTYERTQRLRLADWRGVEQPAVGPERVHAALDL
jgi:hypothetical protein